jgi:acetamidase/formamidase
VIHRLASDADSLRVGVIDAGLAPALEIASGDEVIFDVPGMWGGGAGPGARLDDILALRARHPSGPHSIRGPIHVRGARPGDALRVDVLSVVPARHGINLSLPRHISRGVLRDELPDGALHHVAIDPDALTATLAGVALPVRPFLGIMGVAPAADGAHPSAVPGPFGGNLDLPDLVAGATLVLPVLRPGAGFFAGDGHACQGCGEVNQTAVEAGMDHVHLRLTVQPGRGPALPRAETKTHHITLGLHEDLDEAVKIAVREMVELVAELTGLARADAYALCSCGVDLAVTQVVNPIKGAHAKLPKRILHT